MTRDEWAAAGLGVLAGLLTTVLVVGATSILPILGSLLVYPLLLLLVVIGAPGSPNKASHEPFWRIVRKVTGWGALAGGCLGLLNLVLMIAAGLTGAALSRLARS